MFILYMHCIYKINKMALRPFDRLRDRLIKKRAPHRCEGPFCIYYAFTNFFLMKNISPTIPAIPTMSGTIQLCIRPARM